MANKDESSGKKLKVIILEVKFKSKVNGVMKEITSHGNANTATGEVIYMKLDIT